MCVCVCVFGFTDMFLGVMFSGVVSASVDNSVSVRARLCNKVDVCVTGGVRVLITVAVRFRVNVQVRIDVGVCVDSDVGATGSVYV